MRFCFNPLLLTLCLTCLQIKSNTKDSVSAHSCLQHTHTRALSQLERPTSSAAIRSASASFRAFSAAYRPNQRKNTKIHATSFGRVLIHCPCLQGDDEKECIITSCASLRNLAASSRRASRFSSFTSFFFSAALIHTPMQRRYIKSVHRKESIYLAAHVSKTNCRHPQTKHRRDIDHPPVVFLSTFSALRRNPHRSCPRVHCTCAVTPETAPTLLCLCTSSESSQPNDFKK